MPIKRVLPGYPLFQGSKKISVIDYKGPASYVGGGETLTALQFGEGGIDLIEPMNKKLIAVGGTIGTLIVAQSFSGTYFVTIEVGVATVGAVQSAIIKWYVSATAVEVAGGVDLSAEDIRFLAIFV